MEDDREERRSETPLRHRRDAQRHQESIRSQTRSKKDANPRATQREKETYGAREQSICCRRQQLSWTKTRCHGTRRMNQPFGRVAEFFVRPLYFRVCFCARRCCVSLLFSAMLGGRSERARREESLVAVSPLSGM